MVPNPALLVGKEKLLLEFEKLKEEATELEAPDPRVKLKLGVLVGGADGKLKVFNAGAWSSFGGTDVGAFSKDFAAAARVEPAGIIKPG